MSSPSSNDNSALSKLGTYPDPHGQAALLLTESLIHGLIEQSHLTVAKAIEIIEVALEVSQSLEAESGHVAPEPRPSTLLQALSKSLNHDLTQS